MTPALPNVIGGPYCASRAAFERHFEQLPPEVREYVAATCEVLIVGGGHALPMPRRVPWVLVLTEDALLGPSGGYVLAHECAHAWLDHIKTNPEHEPAADALAAEWGYPPPKWEQEYVADVAALGPGQRVRATYTGCHVVDERGGGA